MRVVGACFAELHPVVAACVSEELKDRRNCCGNVCSALGVRCDSVSVGRIVAQVRNEDGDDSDGAEEDGFVGAHSNGPQVRPDALSNFQFSAVSVGVVRQEQCSFDARR